MSAEEAVSEVVETIEKVRPTRLNLNGTTKNQQFAILFGTAVLGALAGGGVTYLIVNKKLRLKYEQIAEQEIKDAKAFYSALNEKPDLEELAAQYDEPESEAEEFLADDADVAEAVEALKSYQSTDADEGQTDEHGERPAQTIVQNIFVNRQPVEEDTFDYDVEMRERSSGKPYVVTHDEHYENEKDYPQITLTYFEGDDVLADERDSVIDDTEGTVGNHNLLRFGHGSKDKNIVYVQNDQLEVLYEIQRSEGSYAKEVLGFLEHSDDRPGSGRMRKSHWSDDG